jgi:hypothetical protein
MADDRGMVGKSNVLVFIVNTVLACTILPIDLIVDYEGALDINLDRSRIGRNASRSSCGIGVGGNLWCSNTITTNLS